MSPLCVGEVVRLSAAIRATLIALPQGSSLRTGLCSPGPSTLNRPHPPQFRSHPNCAALRLIRDAFAVHVPSMPRCDPRLVLSFHGCTFATCRPLRPRGTFRLHLPSTSPEILALTLG